MSFVLFWGAVLNGCEREELAQVDRNRPPETYVTVGPEPSADPNSPTLIYYRAHLFWRGEDVDGTIAGFRFAVDDTSDPSAWTFTTKTDSVFRFQQEPTRAKEHLFLIRAVDDLGKQDPSPDTLRFEAWTHSSPTVSFLHDRIMVGGGGQPTVAGLDFGDTVLVNSNVSFVWTGNDADGEVARWESALGSENPRQHARNDTTRTVTRLPAGQHQFQVVAIDDAGAVGGATFPLTSNFDPRTVLVSATSTLPRPWLGLDSTLVTVHDFDNFAMPDTIPYNATLELCWSNSDPDGPVVRTFWRIQTYSGVTENLCLDTFDEPWVNNNGQTVTTPRKLNFTELTQTIPVTVRGEDVYGRVEGNPIRYGFHVNFPPTVSASNPGSVPAGVLVQFPFSGYDIDGNSDSLRYIYQFDSNIPSAPTVFPAGQRHVDALFDASQVGTSHTLRIWAQDVGGVESQSAPVVLDFVVTSAPRTEPRAAVSRPRSRGDTP